LLLKALEAQAKQMLREPAPRRTLPPVTPFTPVSADWYRTPCRLRANAARTPPPLRAPAQTARAFCMRARTV